MIKKKKKSIIKKSQNLNLAIHQLFLSSSLNCCQDRHLQIHYFQIMNLTSSFTSRPNTCHLTCFNFSSIFFFDYSLNLKIKQRKKPLQFDFSCNHKFTTMNPSSKYDIYSDFKKIFPNHFTCFLLPLAHSIQTKNPGIIANACALNQFQSLPLLTKTTSFLLFFSSLFSFSISQSTEKFQFPFSLSNSDNLFFEIYHVSIFHVQI